LPDRLAAARGPAGALAAAVLAFASPASASCRFPDGSTDTPGAVARLLFSNSDALGFAVVRQPQDLALDRPEEIEMAFVLKGPNGALALRNPAVGGSVSLGNAETSFGAPAGSLVLAALKRTPSGWVIGECTAQLLNAFPLATLMPELQREYLSRKRRSP
jgi:hypothetical protein